MIVKKYLLQSFEEQPGEVLEIAVPEGSVYLHTTILHDGIYMWYAVSELDVATIVDRYTIVRPGKSIPEGAKFVTLVETVVEQPGVDALDVRQQGIVVFPIYKLD